jgi:hypothetical protein
VFVYPGALRHHGFILIMLVFALWISRYYHDTQNYLLHKISTLKLSQLSIVLINICLALSLLYYLTIQHYEYRYIFSGAKDMANFIKRNNLDNYTIAAYPSPQASALLPFLPGKQFWYADIEDYGTFVAYNKKFVEAQNISNSEIILRINKAFSEQSQILLLLSRPLNFSELNGFILLYKVDQVFGYNLEKYYLYKSIQKES